MVNEYNKEYDNIFGGRSEGIQVSVVDQNGNNKYIEHKKDDKLIFCKTTNNETIINGISISNESNISIVPNTSVPDLLQLDTNIGESRVFETVVENVNSDYFSGDHIRKFY